MPVSCKQLIKKMHVLTYVSWGGVREVTWNEPRVSELFSLMVFAFPHITGISISLPSSLTFGAYLSLIPTLSLHVWPGPLLYFLSIMQTIWSHLGVRVLPKKQRKRKLPKSKTSSIWAWSLALAQLSIWSFSRFCSNSRHSRPWHHWPGVPKTLWRKPEKETMPHGVLWPELCLSRSTPELSLWADVFCLPKLWGRQKSGVTQPAS